MFSAVNRKSGLTKPQNGHFRLVDAMSHVEFAASSTLEMLLPPVLVRISKKFLLLMSRFALGFAEDLDVALGGQNFLAVQEFSELGRHRLSSGAKPLHRTAYGSRVGCIEPALER